MSTEPTFRMYFFYEATEARALPFLNLSEIKDLVGAKIKRNNVFQEILDWNASALSRSKLRSLIHNVNCGCRVYFTKLEQLGHGVSDIQLTLNAMRACNMQAVCLEISPTFDLAGDDRLPVMEAMVAYANLLSTVKGRLIREGQDRARAKGQTVGRHVEVSDTTLHAIRHQLGQGVSAVEAGRRVGVSRWTVYRLIERDALSLGRAPNSLHRTVQHGA